MGMRNRTDDHLALAERHIIEGEQRVAQQHARIKELAAAGHDTSAAETFLKTLLDTLDLMYTHRQQILDEKAREAR